MTDNLICLFLAFLFLSVKETESLTRYKNLSCRRAVWRLIHKETESPDDLFF